LVCFPHVGGAATYYFPLSRSLSPAVEVVAVQYPGRQDRRHEAVVDNIQDLADRAFAVLREVVEPPFALFGHSMGAIVAFEVAGRFERVAGTPPVRLFVSGRRAPSRHLRGGVHLLTDAGLVAELRHVGGTDEAFLADEELRAMLLPVIRADYKAVETYLWPRQQPLTCPITVLVGDRDPQTTVDDAAAWTEHSTAGCDLRVFPGGHFYLDAHHDAVVAEITTALARQHRTDPLEGARP